MNNEKALELLRNLVGEINDCNSPDMLDGYFDYLADKYNEELRDLDIRTIGVVGTED